MILNDINTPYNRLTGRQITDWKTDQVKLAGKRVGKDFLFVYLVLYICSPLHVIKLKSILLRKQNNESFSMNLPSEFTHILNWTLL